MHGLNQRVISQTHHWLSEGAPVWLATVLRTYGSSPRPVGSIMAYKPNPVDSGKAELVGSLSGGCIEEDLLDRLVSKSLQEQVNQGQRIWICRYGMEEEDQTRFALPCGGQLHVLLEYLSPEDAHIKDHILQLHQGLEARKHVFREIDLSSGQRSVNSLPGEIKSDNASSHRAMIIDNTTLQHRLSPGYHLLVVGAGEVSRYLCEFAKSMDFEVSLCDPRENYLNLYAVSDVPMLQKLPDDLISEQFSDEYCAIVTLSHDPRVDDMALLAALPSDAFYIGAMGSAKTSENRRKRLLSLGIEQSQLGKLSAPIGLDIGSKTPAEIALSTLAEVVAVKNQREYSQKQVSSLNSELDLSQISSLSTLR